jgi:methyl-accepting chemotaxis protein
MMSARFPEDTMINNLSIRRKIFIGFGVILSLLVLVSAVTILSVNKISQNSVFVKDIAFRQAIYLIEIESTLRQIGSRISASIDTGTEEGFNKAAKLKNELDKKWLDAETLFSENTKILTNIQDIRDRVNKYFRKGDKLLQLTLNQEWSEIGSATQDFNKSGENIFALIAQLKENGVKRLDEALLEIVSYTRNTVKTNSVIVIIAILAGILMAYTIAYMIVQPIRRLMEVTSAIAHGDLKKEVDIKSTDEIGTLARSFNHMSQSLRQMLTKVHSTFGSLDEVSVQLSKISQDISEGSKQTSKSIEDAYHSVDEMNQTTFHISASMEQFSKTHEETSSWIHEMTSSISELAQNSETLVSSVNETTSSIQQMSVSINQVTENISALMELQTSSSSSIMEISSSIKEVENMTQDSAVMAEKVNKIVKERGTGAVKNAVNGIESTREKVNHTSMIIEQLGRNIENINRIVTVINGIADQTKLLSLNASILAAQAGEHGGGFSVVANEISSLSESTINSTNEIEEVINSIQDESKRAINAMIEGSQSTDEGVSLIQNVEEALSQIYKGVVSSHDISKEIARSTVEQGMSAKLVNQSIAKVTDMCECINKATVEQNEGVTLIVKAAENMKDVSAILKKTAHEQSQGSKKISVSMEDLVSNSKVILGSIVKNRNDTEVLANSIGDINDIYRNNLHAVSQMNATVNVLSRHANLLKEEINKFSF